MACPDSRVPRPTLPGRLTALNLRVLRDIEARMPGRRDTMIRALANVRPSHLLDRKLYDFAGLATRPDETP